MVSKDNIFSAARFPSSFSPGKDLWCPWRHSRPQSPRFVWSAGRNFKKPWSSGDENALAPSIMALNKSVLPENFVQPA